MKSKIYSLDSLDMVVGTLADEMSVCSVFTFEGPLGAGKTTLVKRLLAHCGVRDVVTSPTFTYVAEYVNEKGEEFYHFDLYRLSSQSDFIEAGFSEYLYRPRSWSFIEWPEIIMPLLTHAVCKVKIDYYSEFERSIEIDVRP